MKRVMNSAAALLIAAWSAMSQAAMGDGGALAPEPTVGIGWVFFFLFVFVAICAWFGIAMWRAEKKTRAEASPENAKV